MNDSTKASLFALTSCHSTPGDEDAVAAILLKRWNAAGWQVGALGRYAVTAQKPSSRKNAPVVLFCAHLDSPGYIIQAITDEGVGKAIALGGPHPGVNAVDVWVKQQDGGVRPATMLPSEFPDDPREPYRMIQADFQLQRGDRVCFRSESHFENGQLIAPFLDNRLGCQALCDLAERCSSPDVQVILGATSDEELTGFGASVLARQCQADFVICLDGTYEDDEQGIHMGLGPVLTVTDKSVLLGIKPCQALKKQCDAWGLPLQMEIYNYSGTDARAFPDQGSIAPAIPILLPTQGNHTPEERADEADYDNWLRLLTRLAHDHDAVRSLIRAMGHF